MKTLKKHLRFALSLLLSVGGASLTVSAQGGLMIAAGTQVVSTSNPSIVITDGKWENNGTFTAGNSLVRIEGTATTGNSTIGGASTTTFYNLTQQKTANNIQLMANIGVDNNFTMAGGLFQLNGFDVTLGTATGQIVTETELNRITGTTGGRIIKTMTLTAPAAVNPGNMGATITSAANLGSTTIRRGHQQQTDGASGISIFRYFDIIPTNNTGLNATLRQQYFDAELGGINENELVHYNSLNNVGWYVRGFTARNTTTNLVDNNAYPDFATRWTLASSINQPLPVVFVNEGLQCETDRASLYWTVIENSASDYFQVQWSEDEVEWQDMPDGRINTQGTGRNRYTYDLTESHAFFRVRQVDVDGAFTLSESHRLTCNVAGAWSIWPNPTANILNVKAPFGQSMTGIEITDMFGQVVLRQSMDETLLYTIELDGKLSAAMYMLRITPAKGSPVVKKFEVRH